jgi:hypothetical protein
MDRVGVESTTSADQQLRLLSAPSYLKVRAVGRELITALQIPLLHFEMLMIVLCFGEQNNPRLALFH